MAKKVNHFIREWRKYRQLSVRALAKQAALAPSTIGGLETGNALYSQASLESIAEALQTTPAALLTGPPQRLEKFVQGSQPLGAEMKSLQAWELIIDGQHNVAVELFKADMEKALSKAAGEMFKRMTKELKAVGWQSQKNTHAAE